LAALRGASAEGGIEQRSWKTGLVMPAEEAERVVSALSLKSKH
jgi:hypothetical protein